MTSQDVFQSLTRPDVGRLLCIDSNANRYANRLSRINLSVWKFHLLVLHRFVFR